jgi:hypothetical protein
MKTISLIRFLRFRQNLPEAKVNPPLIPPFDLRVGCIPFANTTKTKI